MRVSAEVQRLTRRGARPRPRDSPAPSGARCAGDGYPQRESCTGARCLRGACANASVNRGGAQGAGPGDSPDGAALPATDGALLEDAELANFASTIIVVITNATGAPVGHGGTMSRPCALAFPAIVSPACDGAPRGSWLPAPQRAAMIKTQRAARCRVCGVAGRLEHGLSDGRHRAEILGPHHPPPPAGSASYAVVFFPRPTPRIPRVDCSCRAPVSYQPCCAHLAGHPAKTRPLMGREVSLDATLSCLYLLASI